jgi:hypothetical protein
MTHVVFWEDAVGMLREPDPVLRRRFASAAGREILAAWPNLAYYGAIETVLQEGPQCSSSIRSRLRC